MNISSPFRAFKAAAGALLLGLASLAHSAVVLQADTNRSSSAATVSISATNLSAGSAIGGFEIELLYDAARWSPATAQFGQFLGDLANFEAFTEADFSVAGVVRLLSISLIGPFDPLPLPSIQPAAGTAFNLATISFDALGNSALGEFRLGNVSLTDEFGDSINVVSEPSTVAAMSVGMLALLAARRRKVAVAQPA